MARINIDWSFLRLIFLSYAVSALLTVYPLSGFATASVMRSVVAGGILSLLNLLLGYAAIEASFEKPHTTFLKYVLGGMVLRLMVMWGMFLVLIRVFDFHAASLMLALLFFYVMNLVLEIYYLQRRVATKQ